MATASLLRAPVPSGCLSLAVRLARRALRGDERRFTQSMLTVLRVLEGRAVAFHLQGVKALVSFSLQRRQEAIRGRRQWEAVQEERSRLARSKESGLFHRFCMLFARFSRVLRRFGLVSGRVRTAPRLVAFRLS